MNADILNRCQLFVDNRTAISTAFVWQSSTLYPCIAASYAMHGLRVDVDRLKQCYQMIQNSVGPFNYFRGTGSLALAAMLDITGDPQTTLDRALQVYDLLKTHFSTSSYLPMASVMIACHVPVTYFNEIAASTRTIYDRMRQEHPFLTSSEDSSFCTLMAMTGMDHDRLLNDMETAYALLKDTFGPYNATQSLSHALALYPGDAAVKAQRTLDLYLRMKQMGHKWGTQYELSMLGVVAMTSDDLNAVMNQVIEASEWLSHQKGFGFWGSISRQQRLMYAGLLVNSVMAADSNTNMTSMAINSTIASIIAQQMATAAVIASTSHH